MDKPNLFDQIQRINLKKDEIEKGVSIKLPNSTAEFLFKHSTTFPNDLFQRWLKKIQLKPLEESLFNTWRTMFSEDEPQNSAFTQSWFQFQVLYMHAGIVFASLIQRNRKILSANTKQELVLLFYKKAFDFKNGQTFFKIGEMSELLIKEGYKNISIQLKQLEIKESLKVSNDSLYGVRKNSILNNSGFKDVEIFEESFWANEKELYQTKLQIEENTKPEFLDFFIAGIQELQEQGNEQICVKNIENKILHEKPFRNYFKALLKQNYNSVEAEPERKNGRIDLKVLDGSLKSPIIIEFKGWWNKDKYNITDQVLSYLTDFEEQGYIFMINHLKTKNILSDYKRKVISLKTNYLKGSWKIVKHKEYSFYCSKHIIGGKRKILNHFIYKVF